MPNATQPIKLFKRFPFITGLTFLAFIVLVFVGIFNCNSFMMQSQMGMEGLHHSMVDCIPGKNCGMDTNQHLSIWQSMFNANINSDFLTLFSTLFLALVVLKIYKSFLNQQVFSLAYRYLYYERDHRNSRLYNYLLRVFAAGILQPKLYT